MKRIFGLATLLAVAISGAAQAATVDLRLSRSGWQMVYADHAAHGSRLAVAPTLSGRSILSVRERNGGPLTTALPPLGSSALCVSGSLLLAICAYPEGELGISATLGDGDDSVDATKLPRFQTLASPPYRPFEHWDLGSGDDNIQLTARPSTHGSDFFVTCGEGLDTVAVVGSVADPLPGVGGDCEHLIDQRG